MPRNKIEDLTNILFESIERLNDEDLTEEELEKEIKRSKATTDIAKTIIDSASLALDATKLKAEWGARNVVLPAMLEDKSDKNNA